MSSRRKQLKPAASDKKSGLLSRTDEMDSNSDRADVRRRALKAGLPHRIWEAGNAAMGDLLNRLGDGRPIPDAARHQMEQAFGTDFSDVRIHDDEVARAQAEALSADAFTRGDDITLGPDAPSPESASGKRLLAHELAHVVQQRRGGKRQSQPVSESGDRFEADADRAAGLAVAGRPALVTATGAPPSVQRQPAEQGLGEKALDFILDQGISYSSEGWKIGGVPIEKVAPAAKTSAKIFSKILKGDFDGALEIINPKDPEDERKALEKIRKIKADIDSLQPIEEQEKRAEEQKQAREQERPTVVREASKRLPRRPEEPKFDPKVPELSQGLTGGPITMWLFDQFDLEKSQLKAKHRRKLNDLADQVMLDDDAELEIVGHTDSSGPDNFNQKLSDQRANAVLDYLIKRGVRAGKIKSVTGKGKTEPFVEEKTDVDRAQNRRVEVYYKSSAVQKKKRFGVRRLGLDR